MDVVSSALLPFDSSLANSGYVLLVLAAVGIMCSCAPLPHPPSSPAQVTHILNKFLARPINVKDKHVLITGI